MKFILETEIRHLVTRLYIGGIENNESKSTDISERRGMKFYIFLKKKVTAVKYFCEKTCWVQIVDNIYIRASWLTN